MHAGIYKVSALLHCAVARAVARMLIGGGGVYSYIRVMPD